MNDVKKLVKSTLPSVVVQRWTQWRVSRLVQGIATENRTRPASEVFDNIYKQNKWGGSRGELYSGTGSTGAAAIAYAAMVNDFITRNGVETVLDIGCGDFRIGEKIKCRRYIGLDVARSVIENNQKLYGSESREFICGDAADLDALPFAQLCLVRQVFQHLSNVQIASIILKLANFDAVIVTEHQPAERDFVSANLDKVHGADTRLFSGSGVYLDRPPFSVQVELLLESTESTIGPGAHNRGYIRSFRIMNDRATAPCSVMTARNDFGS